MGMFDWINCEYDLSEFEKETGISAKELNNANWQTKDIDCILSHFKIKEDKKIYRRKYKQIEFIEDKSSIFGFYNDYKDPYDEPLGEDFTQSVEFYECWHFDDKDYDLWVTFKATFVKGVLDNLKLKELEKWNNSFRKENEKEYEQKIEEYKKKSSSRYYKFVWKVKDFIRKHLISKIKVFILFVLRMLNKF